jgi:hypothetical protein
MRRPAVLTFVLMGLALAALVWPPQSAAIERFYSGLVYPAVQRAMTTFSNVVPFAFFDVLIVGFPLAWLALFAYDVARADRKVAALGEWLLRTLAAVSLLYLVFLAMWGLNYRRLPLERKLPYDGGRVTPIAARGAAEAAVSSLNALYASSRAANTARPDSDPALGAAFADAMRSLGASAATVRARPKRTILNVYFRPAGVAGMTDPYFLETLVESDLLPFERPFVVAHEWSHLAGFADEGEANFAGWLTCARAGAREQYSGWLFLFGELVNSLPRDARPIVVARLDEGPRSDLRAIAARLARDIKPRVSAAGWRVYDRYLKANRVEAGTASYAQVVRLVLGTDIGLSAAQAASPAR